VDRLVAVTGAGLPGPTNTVLDRLLATGWSRSRLLTALTADTADLTHPRGALAWRIEDLLAIPVPPPSPAASASSALAPMVAAALGHRFHRECDGNGGLCGIPLRGAAAYCPTPARRSQAARSDPVRIRTAAPTRRRPALLARSTASRPDAGIQ
jgi:hypothetical protein